MTMRPGFPAEFSVPPIDRVHGAVRLPGSKSISNRALLLAALAQGRTRLRHLLQADDTAVMVQALRTLGIALSEHPDHLQVEGGGGRFPARQADLFLGNAGTAIRPLTAALAFAGGTYGLDGVARMRERPIGDLVDSLNALGARIRYRGQPGYPPLLVEPAESVLHESVQVKGDVSSQFLSSLLMSGPLIARPSGLDLDVQGDLISQPYVKLTVAMMRQFGVEVVQTDERRFHVPRSAYRAPGDYAIEGDASGASYFLALGLLAGGPVRVLGVGKHSMQGDIAFADLLRAQGARISMGDDWIEAAGGGEIRAVEHDCTAIPDAAMTAAVVACFARGRTVLRGIGSWRVKETDRIGAMAVELRKLGADVEEGADWLAVNGPAQWRPAPIATYDDHRIAMCFSLAAAAGIPVTLLDPGCVAKTFPGYFLSLRELLPAEARAAVAWPG